MVVRGRLVDLHASAAQQHVHVSRDVREVPLPLTIKRKCAGITAAAIREITDVEALLGWKTTRAVGKGDLQRWQATELPLFRRSHKWPAFLCPHGTGDQRFLPSSVDHRHMQAVSPLQAANRSTINTFGLHTS